MTLDLLIVKLLGWIGQILPIFMGLAVVFFLWGIVKFLLHADDEKTHDEGKNLMIWGMIALFVMVGMWGIIGYVQRSIGLTQSVSGTAPSTPIAVPVPPAAPPR